MASTLFVFCRSKQPELQPQATAVVAECAQFSPQRVYDLTRKLQRCLFPTASHRSQGIASRLDRTLRCVLAESASVSIRTLSDAISDPL